MLKSTQNQSETLQIKSQTEDIEADNVEKFYEPIDLSINHIFPCGYLWTDHPQPQLSWMHNHNHFEIGRCNKGSGTYCVDSEIHRIRTRCCTIIYEGQFHSAQSNPYDISEWNYLYIDLAYFLSFMEESAKKCLIGLEWQDYVFPSVMSEKQYPEIMQLIDAIFEESSSNKPNREEALAGMIYALLICHSRYMTPTTLSTSHSRPSQRILPAISYIHNHYSENFSIGELCRLCFVSEATLRRDFQLFAETSPGEYLKKIRIKNAAVMLTNTDKNILEISLDVGYPTVSSFNRQFFAHYKLSPREYRKKNIAKN